jgi:hypothetical protein
MKIGIATTSVTMSVPCQADAAKALSRYRSSMKSPPMVAITIKMAMMAEKT